MNAEIEELFKQRRLINARIGDLQDKCPHENVDVYEDSRQDELGYNIWYPGVDVYCEDCGKQMWFTEGTDGYDLYFPKIKPHPIPEATILWENDKPN